MAGLQLLSHHLIVEECGVADSGDVNRPFRDVNNPFETNDADTCHHASSTAGAGFGASGRKAILFRFLPGVAFDRSKLEPLQFHPVQLSGDVAAVVLGSAPAVAPVPALK